MKSITDPSSNEPTYNSLSFLSEEPAIGFVETFKADATDIDWPEGAVWRE
jgi:hypothetical protein